MGWNSWNYFAGKVTDKDIRDTAGLLVSTGMRDAGYVYVNIDDTWEGERDATGKIHSNENPEKYYSVAEVANLGETTEPEIVFLHDASVNGAVTASVDYGFHGWVIHHNSDIWALTTMVGGDPCWADWPASPVLKGAAEFALDLLVPDELGRLVTSPSTSPENHFIDPKSGSRVAVSRGSTMDMALVRQLFENTIAASKALGVDADLRAKLEATLPKLLLFQIGSQGQLQEWSSDFKEWEPTHRHSSHLVSVWPLDQITPSQPEFFAAARVSEDLRKSGGYHPDKAGMWAACSKATRL